MTMDGKSALLSMKSGFAVLVTLIQIVITKCSYFENRMSVNVQFKISIHTQLQETPVPCCLLGSALHSISAQKAAVCDCGRSPGRGGGGEVRVCIQQWDRAI